MTTKHKVLPVVVLSTMLLSGCSLMSSEGSIDPALSSCPANPIALDVRIDASGSSSSSHILAERITIIRDALHRAALCGGRAKISVFSSSSGASVTLYEGEVKVDGATDQAKSRRVGAVVDGIIEAIRKNYAQAISSLPTGGSDIPSQVRLVAEYTEQLPGYQLDEYLLTDGLSNVGIDLESPLTTKQATDLAASIEAADLSGAWLTIAGLGRVDDNSTSSAQTEALVAFYSTLCNKTSAASCTVVTDFTARW